MSKFYIDFDEVPEHQLRNLVGQLLRHLKADICQDEYSDICWLEFPDEDTP